MELKPRRRNAIKQTYQVSKKAKNIIELYAKYGNMEEGEIIDFLTEEVIKNDMPFLHWLSQERFKKKIDSYNLLEHYDESTYMPAPDEEFVEFEEELDEAIYEGETENEYEEKACH